MGLANTGFSYLRGGLVIPWLELTNHTLDSHQGGQRATKQLQRRSYDIESNSSLIRTTSEVN